MRYSVFNKDEQLVPAPSAGEPMENYKFWYLPRIRCHDCPGKLYTPGPEMTVGNFEVHLKNRFHREKVDQRLAREAAANGVAPPASSLPAESASPSVPPPAATAIAAPQRPSPSAGFGSFSASEGASRKSGDGAGSSSSGSASQTSTPGAG